ncbi:UDP-2,3-diacylglucosamine diphosphatase [Piscinibacter sakaiensis]|uniref:UDP-2,3-diacylglucosamine diphosphatase n=1 Tax=Piscinibacter sakaiensis TaxID=1547922 RepID=UPI003AAE3FDA
MATPPAAADVPTRLPRFWEFEAPAAWRQIDFISDLHLADDRPRTSAAFASHLRETPADAVFLLGDIFDLWVGDDTITQGFEARVVDLLAEAAARRSIAIMVGNRDFLLGDRMLKASGAMALADPTVLVAFGRRFLLSHGDALCLGDTAYQRFRAEVRSTRWQHDFLALPIDERRRQAQAIRQESERRKQSHQRADWVDVDPGSAVRWMHEAGAPVLIHGHTHCPGSEPMAPGLVRHVLSDWELDDAGQPTRAEVLRLSADGFERLAPAGC